MKSVTLRELLGPNRRTCARTGCPPRVGDVVLRHFPGLPHECFTILGLALGDDELLRADDPRLGGTVPVVARVVAG
jgi:hypothetical protein